MASSEVGSPETSGHAMQQGSYMKRTHHARVRSDDSSNESAGHRRVGLCGSDKEPWEGMRAT